MFKIIPTKKFQRKADLFFKQHPDQKIKFNEILKVLEKDPFTKLFRNHELYGNMSGLRSVSLNYQYRMTLEVMVLEKTIYLINIGSHEDVYQAK